MDLIKWLVAGAIGGAVGAAVWAAIAYYGHVEISGIAWGVGALVGISVRVAAADDTCDFAGIVAALLAAASVLAGKYAAAKMFVDDEIAEIAGAIEVDDHRALVWIADQLIDRRVQEGRPVNWPEGMTQEDAYEEADYPADVWAEAKASWDAMNPDQQAQYKQQVSDYLAADLENFRAEAQEAVFTGTFSLWDLLFFCLAVGTAFMIASGRGGSDGE